MRLISMLCRKDIDQILDRLNKIESMLEEIQSKQEEQANCGTPIVASLEAMTKYYMDYINKEKDEDTK